MSIYHNSAPSQPDRILLAMCPPKNWKFCVVFVFFFFFYMEDKFIT